MTTDPEVPTFLYPHAIRSIRSSKRSVATIQDGIISVASEKSMSVSAKCAATLAAQLPTGKAQDLHSPSLDQFGDQLPLDLLVVHLLCKD